MRGGGRVREEPVNLKMKERSGSAALRQRKSTVIQSPVLMCSRHHHLAHRHHTASVVLHMLNMLHQEHLALQNTSVLVPTRQAAEGVIIILIVSLLKIAVQLTSRHWEIDRVIGVEEKDIFMLTAGCVSATALFVEVKSIKLINVRGDQGKHLVSKNQYVQSAEKHILEKIVR